MLFPKTSSFGLAVIASSCIDVVVSRYPITGVQTGINTETGETPARRNIYDLYNDEKQFALYIQAMNELMNTNETTVTSWFEIAGIHGRPYTAWDDDDSPKSGLLTGYCPHGNTLFPTWHRPYLALIEQVMAEHAQKIAADYNSAEYNDAADNLRLPYWDWAEVPYGFPDILTWPSIEIVTADGEKNVTNPLYRYDFQRTPEPADAFPNTLAEAGGDATEVFLGSQEWTLRRPDSSNASQELTINSEGFDINNNSQMLRDQVWTTFAKSKDYNTMATLANSGASFEVPHGWVHVTVGGTDGHMTSLSYSAFDPSFWLHHANVDRLIAMWQAAYPDQWLEPEPNEAPTFTMTTGEMLDENTPLYPFLQNDSTPHTSNSSRFTKNFGYSYSDIQYWLFSDPADLAKNVTLIVNQLYNKDYHLVTPGPNGTSTATNFTADPAPSVPFNQSTITWNITAPLNSTTFFNTTSLNDTIAFNTTTTFNTTLPSNLTASSSSAMASGQPVSVITYTVTGSASPVVSSSTAVSTVTGLGGSVSVITTTVYATGPAPTLPPIQSLIVSTISGSGSAMASDSAVASEAYDWASASGSAIPSGAATSLSSPSSPTDTPEPDSYYTTNTKTYGGGDHTPREWTVSISVPNSALNDTFSVKCTADHFVIGKLVVNNPGQDEAYQGTNRTSHGEFTLRNALRHIDTSDVPACIAHLQKNLKCDVLKKNGRVVDKKSVKGLKIEVADEEVELAKNPSEFPSFGNRTVHGEITP